MIFGFLGFSTESDADHDVSPLSELAVQVYNPVSSVFKSGMIYVFISSHFILKFQLLFIFTSRYFKLSSVYHNTYMQRFHIGWLLNVVN